MPDPERAAWTVAEWMKACPLGKTKVYELIAAGEINSVTVGRRRLIVTPPADFLGRRASRPSSANQIRTE